MEEGISASTWKILEGETTFRNFGRGGYRVEKEKRKKCRPLVAERLAVSMFVFLLPSTRTFRAKVVYRC